MPKTDKIKQVLTKEFSIEEWQVESVISLIDEGNTIPFIARYRKEKTGALSDEVLRDFYDRLTYLRGLEDKKEEINRLIDEQGNLTEDIAKAIEEANTLAELEDIYRPFRPKRRTRATIAKEKGLEPLADLIEAQEESANSIESEALMYIDIEKGVETTEDAIMGAMDIIAERISDNAEFRKAIREKTLKNAIMVTKGDSEEDSVYSLYYEFSQSLSKLANHQILAINRGEKEGFLSVKFEMEPDIIHNYLYKKMVSKKPTDASQYVEEAVRDSYKRLIAPSIETEIRAMLTEEAQEASIKVFNKNLSGLLLQPPIKGRVVLGLDPGYRTGCKIAVVDETGRVLDTGIGYFTLPNHDKEKAKKIIKITDLKLDKISFTGIPHNAAMRICPDSCSTQARTDGKKYVPPPRHSTNAGTAKKPNCSVIFVLKT